MKICVTSQGDSPDSAIDPRFGRAAKFFIYDTESGEFNSVDNAQNLNAAQGAGIQAAQTVAGSGVSAVLTGHCGPKAFSVLRKAGIDIYLGASGSVLDAIEAWKQGKLEKASQPDKAGHWQ